MAVLFGGKSSDSFASLCYNSLSKKMINAKSFVTPERLPSIESSTKYHCQRVYLQIMVWMGEDGYMNTMDSGWLTQNCCHLWPMWLLSKKTSWRWSTEIAQLIAEHNVAVASHIVYHAHLLVNNDRLWIATMIIINLYGRKSWAMTTNDAFNGGYEKYWKKSTRGNNWSKQRLICMHKKSEKIFLKVLK